MTEFSSFLVPRPRMFSKATCSLNSNCMSFQLALVEPEVQVNNKVDLNNLKSTHPWFKKPPWHTGATTSCSNAWRL